MGTHYELGELHAISTRVTYTHAAFPQAFTTDYFLPELVFHYPFLAIGLPR